MEENKLRSLWAIVSMNGFLPMKRQPLFLINTLASPFSFLFFLVVVGIGATGNATLFIVNGVAGGMVLTVLTIGTGLQADMTHYRTDLKFQEMVVASPVRAGTYVTGMALSEFVYSIPGMSVFVVLSVIYAHYVPFGGLLVVASLLLLWIFATALGFTLATYFADVRETFMISPLISIFLSVVPPVYYPIQWLPVYLRPIAYLSPTTWAANLVQGALGIVPIGWAQGVEDGLVLIVAAVILFVIAWKKAQWRET